jgi:hypothetical protein
VIALLVALAVVALASLQPWAANSVAPHLSVPPAADVGLGDSVAVAPAAGVDVGDAAVAADRKATLVVKPAQTDASGHAAEPAIAPARVVARPGPVAVPEAPSQPEAAPPATPVAAPTPAPEASPAPSPPPPIPVATGNGGTPPPIAAGVGTPAETAVALQVHDGDEYALSFSFSVEPTAYRLPGSENLIMRFKGETSESPSFGLQLWDDGSERGLWSSGEAMGGERFLAPVEDLVEHELSVDFRASSEGEGFYLICLDGRPIDVAAGVDLIDPGADDALLEVGLFRDGEAVQGSPEIRFEAVELGEPQPALP